MRAFIFPGQGSQKVGMGAELADASAAAREVFQEVDDALGQKLFAIMREGPDDQLTLTENAQPAIMANAIATLRVLEKEGGIAIADKGDCVAGHSLGEYTALAAVGAFSLADTARLLKLRGMAMQAAVPVGEGAMCALLGADIDKATALAAANVTAAAVTDPIKERRLLVEQVTGRVRWRESVLAMKAAGVEHFVELGGKVLGPMIGRTVEDVTVTSVVSMADIETLAKEI